MALRITLKKLNLLSQNSPKFLTNRPILETLSIRSQKWVRCQSSEPVTQTIADIHKSLKATMGVPKGYTPLKIDRAHLLEMLPSSQDELPPRKMNDSFDHAIIPLSYDLDMREKYCTINGTVRIGRLMEDMDIFAAWLAFKHIENPKQKPDLPTPYNIVTALVDQIDFSNIVPSPDADIRLSGHVSWVGKSSVEVVVWLEQYQHGAWRKITKAIFLMVARNSTNTQPAIVNKLVATTPEEENILSGGIARKQRREKVQKANLLRMTPDAHEQHIIHQLFLDTVDPQDVTFESRQLPPDSRWMSDTVVMNVIRSHPENRNLHNKVFGGFLMRQAVELSWTCCFAQSHLRPRLVCMSDVVFRRPVEVGALLRMNSKVVYTESNYVQVTTYANVSDSYGGTGKTSNVFHFTYEVPHPASKIYPSTYNEAMAYLDGRRHFQHAMGLSGGAQNGSRVTL